MSCSCITMLSADSKLRGHNQSDGFRFSKELWLLAFTRHGKRQQLMVTFTLGPWLILIDNQIGTEWEAATRAGSAGVLPDSTRKTTTLVLAFLPGGSGAVRGPQFAGRG
jgi:hypothetical protein